MTLYSHVAVYRPFNQAKTKHQEKTKPTGNNQVKEPEQSSFSARLTWENFPSFMPSPWLHQDDWHIFLKYDTHEVVNIAQISAHSRSVMPLFRRSCHIPAVTHRAGSAPTLGPGQECASPLRNMFIWPVEKLPLLDAVFLFSTWTTHTGTEKDQRGVEPPMANTSPAESRL